MWLVAILFVVTGVILGVTSNENAEENAITNYGYSTTEKKLVEQLRNSNKEYLTLPYLRSDKYLINWIRDNPTNFDQVQTKFRKFLKYRQDRNLDKVLGEDWSDWRRNYPFGRYGQDYVGCEVAGWNLGKWDIRKAILSQPRELNRYFDWVAEYLNSFLYTSPCLNATIIGNLHGFTLRQHGCIQCLHFIIQVVNILENHYPMSLKSLVLVNVPRIFQPVLRIILPLFSIHTGNALKVFGHDRTEWVKFLQTFIPTDILPPEYGGTRNTRPKKHQQS